MMAMKSSIAVFGLLMSAWPSEPSAGTASGDQVHPPESVPALPPRTSIDASDLPLLLALAAAFDLAFFLGTPLVLSAAGCSGSASAYDEKITTVTAFTTFITTENGCQYPMIT